MTGHPVDRAATWASAYVHVPFCGRVCPYCDFAVVAGADDLVDRYVDAVVTEIGRAGQWRPLDAVFVGGGTPSRIGAARLGRLLDALRERFRLAIGAEVTLEANPEDWSDGLASALVEAGFTRVSFGAQSFDEEVLAYLGRRHDPSAIEAGVRSAREMGFASVSLDLIFGSPVETAQSWRRTLDRAVGLGPDHVSCYSLTVERGTPLGRAVAGGAPAPDPDVQADEYQTAASVLADAGLVRYEVSNWARPGHGCRYNLAVWAQAEYEAFGNGAHGFRHGRRIRNIRRLDAYLDRIERGDSARAGSDDVTGWDGEVDRLFVGLRRVAGVADGAGVDAFLAAPEGRRLLAAGVVSYDGRLRVVDPLLTDEVERVVLSLPTPSDRPPAAG